jgi:hypothetical protein
MAYTKARRASLIGAVPYPMRVEYPLQAFHTLLRPSDCQNLKQSEYLSFTLPTCAVLTIP